MPLRRSLRLKNNLCTFATSFADIAGLDWNQEPNDEILGGNVVICEGAYTREIHDDIMEKHVADGNYPIDALVCTPPWTRGCNSSSALLKEWGLKIWDGTNKAERRIFPKDIEHYRVVKYESCRGLEGWTVICLGFDRFFENKKRFAHRKGKQDLLEHPEDQLRKVALSWCLIPLTRAIDTLVLQVSGSSELTDILRSVYDQHKDFVDWRSGNTIMERRKTTCLAS